MINLNTAIEQKINEFILGTQSKFSQFKSDSLASLQTEVANITQETNTLQEELNQKLSQPDQAQLKDQIGTHTTKLLQTIDLLFVGQSSENAIDVLTQETDSLVKEITLKFDANAPDPELPELKQKLTAWQTKVKDTLVKFSTTVELHQKNESLIANLKDNLSKYSSIPEVDEPFEKLIKEFKDNFTQLQEASILFQTLDSLTDEIKARDEAIKLDQRIDALIERTKTQVAGFSLELDREVQGELAKLIKILGIAQVELMKNSEPCSVMQVKSVVDYGEIAINSLTGQPNIILAQKLRYAAKTGLREIKKYRGSFLANFRDNIFHSIKIPTKVLIGLVVAIPLNWGIMNIPLVKDLLSFLPPINQQETASQTASQTASFPRISTEAKEFIVLILMTGTLGGAVSLLTRLKDFDDPKNQKYDDDLLPFLIGLTKPILGGSFAFFILLILNSSLSPFEIRGRSEDNGNGIYLYGLLAMAFVAGFSERLIPDLISQVEKKVTVVESSSTGQGLPPEISINPPSKDLALEGKQEFTINPVGKYTITISPDIGTIDTTTTDAKFTYTAPSTGNAGDTITITVTSDSGQTAKATVTLKIA
jgi:hypothetical protein